MVVIPKVETTENTDNYNMNNNNINNKTKTKTNVQTEKQTHRTPTKHDKVTIIL